MCLLIFSFREDPRYPLVLAANRDEFHARPTAPAAFWSEHPLLLAGRDLDQGGTWMGLTREGRFSAITNCRDPARTAPAPRSRGELTLDYLIGEQSPQDYLQALRSRADQYAGFNLLVGTTNELWYLSNWHEGTTDEPQQLAPGLYGLSNAQLDTPWPKVTLGKQRLSALLKKGEPNHDSLDGVVADRQLADNKDLRDLGLDDEMARVLSSQFITTDSYGTRSTTSLWTTASSAVHWRESSFNEQGELTAQHTQHFAMAAARG